ncbi:root phototropism protein 2-like [Nymphaea colorata]|nr:root phototropism protein 2-like [Nymphaea colorata]
MAAPTKSARLSVAVEKTGKWVLSQDVPSDVVVQVGETNFCLHKFMLVTKCGHIRKLILESSETDLSRIDLPDLPGGPEIFEKVAKFCYGENFEITVRNVAALRCAGEYLEMSEAYCQENLISRTEEFLARAALTTFSGAIAVLKSCEEFMPMAAELEIVQQCLDVASLKAYNESNSPMRPPPGRWMEELSILSVDSFKQFMVSLKSRGARMQTLAATVMTFAERSLRELVRDRTGGAAISGRAGDVNQRRRQRETLEGIVGTMPDETTAFPVSFLCCLLRAAIFLDSALAVRGELEQRVAAVLEHAAVDDLLAVGMGYEGERLVDHESVRRIVAEFAEKEKERKGSSLRDAAVRGTASEAMQRVAKTVDLYLAEIATDGDLSISTFTAMAVLIPKSARTHDDDLYRAADIYLKAHPGLDEIDREKVCSIMDPLSLSHNARVHASQNKRLPVQVVLHVVYYDQLTVRCEDHKLSDASITRNQVSADVSLIRENESLRMELDKMKAIVSGLQRGSEPAAAAKTSKRPTFFASVSKTFGKLNPFRHGSKDTSQIEIITCGSIDITKPKKRRFSLS